MNIPGVTRNVSPKQPIAPFALSHPRYAHNPVCPTPQPIETKR
ncbi:hypothetical protein [Microcoleus sp. K4-C2]